MTSPSLSPPQSPEMPSWREQMMQLSGNHRDSNWLTTNIQCYVTKTAKKCITTFSNDDCPCNN
eukprot:1244452-Amphidinium_carterae.1